MCREKSTTPFEALGERDRLCHLSSEFAGGFGEDFGVEVDVGFGGGGAH
jgi:hypothetical protein